MRLLLLVLLAFSVQAETIYKCGKAYSSEPCPNAEVLQMSREANVVQATPITQDTTPSNYTVYGGSLPSYGQSYRPGGPTGYTVSTPFGQFSSKDPIRVDGVGLRQGVTINGVTYRKGR